MPQPRQLMTLDDWVALPEDESSRLEVQEGIPIIAPPSRPFHQRAATRLAYLIDDQLPDGLSALSEVGVVLTERPLTARIPDVVVANADLVATTNPSRFSGQDIRLAVEVLSDGIRRTDRVTKFAEYAEAGIEQYWIVDLAEPATLTVFRLVGEAYGSTSSAGRRRRMSTVCRSSSTLTR